jgi:hypothetical protein
VTNSFRAFGLLACSIAAAIAGCSLNAPSAGDDDDGSENSPGGSSSGSQGVSGTGPVGSGGSSGTSGASGSGGTGKSGSGGSNATAGSSSAAGTSSSGGFAGTLGVAGTPGSAGTAGTAGTPGSAGTTGSAGSGAGSAGAAGSAGSAGGGNGDGSLGSGMMTGSGRSDEQYATAEVTRNGVPYILITNGWGPGFGEHVVSWNGTSFIVESMAGSAGSQGEPASYPSVFCGKYSVRQIPDCGLPAALDSIGSLRTGWRWSDNGNAGEYNAAYDIWLGDGTRLQMYLMVWLRDPPNFQPAGSANAAHQGVTVANVPGVWNIWNGTVNGLPIINWVRATGMESSEIEFDVMDFVRDAQSRGLSLTGTHINAVAVGFEIWQGPITNLESVDFYVDAK